MKPLAAATITAAPSPTAYLHNQYTLISGHIGSPLREEKQSRHDIRGISGAGGAGGACHLSCRSPAPSKKVGCPGEIGRTHQSVVRPGDHASLGLIARSAREGMPRCHRRGCSGTLLAKGAVAVGGHDRAHRGRQEAPHRSAKASWLGLLVPGVPSEDGVEHVYEIADEMHGCGYYIML